MLVLRLELWPGGDGRARRKIGEVIISNVTNLTPVSDYDALFVPGDGRIERRRATVRGHARRDGAWPLVAMALKALRLERP